MGSSLQQMRMSSPCLFSNQSPTSVLSRWMAMEEQLSESVEAVEQEQQLVRQSPTLRMTTWVGYLSCRRRC